ncbi:MAG: AAA family ATPase, partial [Roseburia sp.]|nr:AAA family ATPase [Roseburia sp.]
MICQFTFENYKAFKGEAALDFLAEKIGEHENSLIVAEECREKAVPVIAIYGPNGGGKSTVLEALNFLRATILRVIVITKLHDEEDKYESVMRKLYSFPSREIYYKLSSECKELPTKFEIMFCAKGKKFKYQLSILKNRIVQENLYSQEMGTDEVELFFERSEEECILGEEIEDIAVEKVNDNIPLLSHIAINYDIETIDVVVKWFWDMEILNYDNPQNEKKLFLPKSEEKRKQIFGMLEEMDIAIKGIRVEKDLDGN